MALRASQRRRRLSMTSLIDVIFLLLLFFMLSSTFSKFAEVELAPAQAGENSQVERQMIFMKIDNADQVVVNGRPAQMSNLVARVEEIIGETSGLVAISLDQEATAQALTDVLVELRALEDVQVQVLAP
ncbi:MAG: biopolymer transporter ExbD [Pseudomonadota bacterium]